MNATPPAMQRWLLLAPLLALLAILPLGHVQALRTVLCCALGIAAITVRPNPDPRTRPLFLWWLAWLGFGLASALWSVTPELTLRSGVYELVLPVVVFFGAVRLVSDLPHLKAASLAIAFGIAGLGLMALAAYLVGRPFALVSADYQHGMFRYHPGVGVATTFVALAFPLWLMLLHSDRVWHVAALALIGVTLAIGAAAPNRMFWITLFGTTLAFVLARRRDASARSRWRPALIIAIAGAVMTGMLVFTLQQRVVTGVAASADVMASVNQDWRIAGWPAWAAQVSERPLLGTGFGKEVPAAAYGAALPPTVRQNVFPHAHNLVLNILLQVGIVGLALYVVLLVVLTRYYGRALGDSRTATFGRAGIALVTAMVLKNATDDFMDYAIVIAFWAIAGMLVGVIAQRRAHVRATPS